MILDTGLKNNVKYCDKCLSTDIHVGNIFDWLELQPKKPYKNFREYQSIKNRIRWAEEKDAIAQEIEDEINSLYV